MAAVQLTATADTEQNLVNAAALIDRAAEHDATLVVLPELFSCMGTRAQLLAGAQPLDGGTIRWAAGQARIHSCWLVAGSIAELRGDERLANTSCLISPEGEVVAIYRKLHLFDNDVPGAALRESATFDAGTEIVVTDVPPIPIGMATCYDLRFPEQFRALALRGARLVVLPAAFTAATGPAHWEILVRARAIEDQVFIVAADQVGASSATLRWHGHSMIVDPWGTVLAASSEATPGVIVADLDLDAQDAVRRQLPSLEHRRPEVYEDG